MRFDTVIRNGTVVTATDTCRADVGINGDKVTAIAAQLPTENAGRIIDATGMLLIPGGIVCFRRLSRLVLARRAVYATPSFTAFTQIAHMEGMRPHR